MLYIDHRSIWLDIKLTFLTVIAVCRKIGAC
jgi:lipopolysaccharide/colanic/teichoic acid biosynthesis glycosyltransferase